MAPNKSSCHRCHLNLHRFLSWKHIALVAVFLTNCISQVFPFEIHLNLTDVDSGGKLIIDHYLGTEWQSALDEAESEQVLPFIVFNATTGKSIVQNVICEKLRTNPVNLRVLSKRVLSSGTIQTVSQPYLIFLHGPNCQKEGRLLMGPQLIDASNESIVNPISISIQFSSYVQCFKPGDALLSMYNFIPLHLHSCSVRVMPTNWNLEVNHDTLDLSFLQPVCFKGGQGTREIVHVYLKCRSGQSQAMSYFITFDSLASEAFHAEQISLSRKKRALSNTPPIFKPDQYVVHVKEEEDAGYPVKTVTATDSDTGDAGVLTYRMEADVDTKSQQMFAISPQTGQIKTTQKLDREVMSAHYFTIFATDNAIPVSDRMSATASLTIYIDDINDNGPSFNQEVVHIKVPENGRTHDIFTANAIDYDDGDNAKIRYSILNSGPPNTIFMIDPSSGAISLTQTLDREKTSKYTLLILATDQGDARNRKSSTMTLQIQVLDENDNSPVFTNTSYIINLKENHPTSNSKSVLKLQATDKDAGPNSKISYRLSQGGENHFSVNETTGEMFLIQPLDYEYQDQFKLAVRAEDQGRPVKRTTMFVIVKVIDVNDNTPEFLLSTYHQNVKEDIGVGKLVLKVEAEDLDSGQNAQMSYSIVTGSSKVPLPFTIDEQSGLITTNAKLDRESVSNYVFAVMAQDNGAVKESATVSVTIVLTDVNDNKPTFEQSSYNVSISEAAKKQEDVITLEATDKDEGMNAVLSYKIEQGNDRDAFKIRKIQGKAVIKVNKKLDARTQQKYKLTVSATDNSGLSASTKVNIFVLDTNRNAPVFDEQKGFEFSVKEDVPSGTVVFSVLARDDDRGKNAEITYSISPVTMFSIDPNTGVIKTRQKLDRELEQDYILTVTASDNGNPSMSATAELVVTITDVNDHKPEFRKHVYEGSVKENIPANTIILNISATDKDKGANSVIHYTFGAGSDGDGMFTIDSRGVIRLAEGHTLDREQKASYDLIAYAVDSGDPPLSASVTVEVKVLDVNDNSPRFDPSVYKVYVRENSPIGTTIATITATDPDEGQNAEVTYSMASGSDTEFFTLSGRIGDPAIITTLKPLNYEDKSGKTEYKVVLKAASDTKISTAEVLIYVKDVNDNVPLLKDFSIIFNNFAGSFPSGPIGKVPAYDPDVSDQDKLVYKILSGNKANLISLNEKTGEITLDALLNSDVPRTGVFRISVSDGDTQVPATCHLWVRLVTMAMLDNAVTIRLDKMTRVAFLSPILTFFTDALASIFDTNTSNVFIIDVLDDTDVNEQILNVTVSIRSNSVIVQGQSVDVFYEPEYIREVIYLQRSALANQSSLQVLPFDDNVCLREPCLNFEECRSVVKEVTALPCIASSTVLFRPIQRTQKYKCVCPTGFAGMDQQKMCDTEIDLCYSFPCLNKGTCNRKESGYTCQCTPGFSGPVCEYNMTAHYDSVSCPSSQCHAPSHCQPEPSPGGGFACQGCPQDGLRDAQCRLRTRFFQDKSYLTFPGVRARNRFTIQLRFATQSKNGLLFYNGRFNGEYDFMALEVKDGQVHFHFCLGSNVTTSVATRVKAGVSTGQWTTVTVEYVSRVATVTVGEDCDTEIVITYGDRLDNPGCAVRVQQHLAPECDKPASNCNRLLDLTGPLQIGGLPESIRPSKFVAESFSGCISDIYLDYNLLDLDSAVSNHLTSVGCPPKEVRCNHAPCQMGGKCREGWNTYLCDCPERTGGKDCSQTIDESKQLKGKGYMTFDNPSDPIIRLPWINGIAFRTRSAGGVLMQILLNKGQVVIRIANGYLVYQHGSTSVQMDMVRVDDGQWHYFDVRWYNKGISYFLDYGEYTLNTKSLGLINNLEIKIVYIGVLKDGDKPLTEYFTGCIKDLRVGNTDHAFLKSPTMLGVSSGCGGSAVCSPNPCGNGNCVDGWNKHTCQCPSGTIGPTCQDICTNYNPCQNWAECRSSPSPGDGSSGLGYHCQCGQRQSGRYCGNQAPNPCPSGWWGKPVCGPCHCDESKGFKASCDKSTGSCSCKALHYMSKDSKECLPCDCYSVGAKNLTCNANTGYCECFPGIIGRRCDQCLSRYAGIKQVISKVDDEEVRFFTCIVNYSDCPRNYGKGIWWDPILFGLEASQDCPLGATGTAKRKCTKEKSWHIPDLFNCTSDSYLLLLPQLLEFENKSLNPFIANFTIGRLKDISYTTSPIYGGDIMMTYRYVRVILDYELSHSGLGMISQQYRSFIQKLLVVISNVTNEKYSHYWQRVDKETNGGASHLMNLFNAYITKIVQQLPQAQSGTFEAVSGDMVLGTDWIDLSNFTGVTLPKYDNNVKKGSLNEEVEFTLPEALLRLKTPVSNTSSLGGDIPKAYVGYVVFKNLAKQVSMRTDSTIRRSGRLMTVNSPAIDIIVADKAKVYKGKTAEPISIKFRLTLPNNRTNMHCVRWVGSSDYDPRSGTWTNSDCWTNKTSCRVTSDSDRCEEFYVTCQCRHLSIYAVIIDVADGTSLLPAIVEMQAVTYVLATIALLLLLVSFFVLFTFRRLQSNWNSIRVNIIFTIFIIQLSFIIGIDQVANETICHLVAISLHYFYMAAFAWVFVELLHIYRLLTEKQTINYGPMKFYYMLGYVLPGIVVGLAVGLYLKAYEIERFCWLSTSDGFIWSFAGPITFQVVLSIVTFIMTARASCAEKIPVTDVGAIRVGLLSSILLLLLLSGTWVLGLLAVNYNILALQYLNNIFMFLEGIFVFLAYIVLSKKVRWVVKRFYWRMKGKKLDFDDNQAGNRPPTQSRSALAYRNDSSADGSGGVRLNNIGISTLSTTSRSSKGSALHKSKDFLHSTSSSASAGIAHTNIPFGFDSPMADGIKEERGKGGDSDSDSDGSMDRNSLELASSHSSDEDDEFETGTQWEHQVPKSKTLEMAQEELERKKKAKARQRLGNNIEEPTPRIEELVHRQPSPPPYQTPVNPPDVTLTSRQHQAHKPPLPPPRRDDSLRSSPAMASNSPVVQPVMNKVPVLTHNGSVSSDTE